MTDYSKAVKTMDYSIQLKKMHELRFGKNPWKLIMDCLNYRYQFVQVNDKESGYLQVTHSVPEDSIVGPVLFIIHILDVSGHTSGTCFQYVDDTSLYCHTTVKDLDTCVKQVNNDLVSIKSWSISTNLIFNSTKTKMLLFSTKQ